MLAVEETRSPIGQAHEPDVSELHSRTVEAPEATVRRAAASIDVVGPLVDGLIAMGVRDHIVTPCSNGLVWSFDEADDGQVRLAWDVSVIPETEETTLVAIALRATASNEAGRERLLDAWPVLGPVAELHVERALHRIEALAEDISE